MAPLATRLPRFARNDRLYKVGTRELRIRVDGDPMDVKEAVGIAKRYVTDPFADEAITHVGPEEVVFDEQSGHWKVTIGFAPHWNQINAWSAATACWSS